MVTGSRISVPLLSAEDVIPHLGKASHWKEGRSAKLLADSWFNADGIPRQMKVLLSSSEIFPNARLVDGWLERKTDLGDGCGSPSQTDLLALISEGTELAVLGVEAKVDESFGPLVHEWLADGSLRKHQRLHLLCARLGIEPGDVQSLRYQLLHRTVAVLLEAERFHTDRAVLAVQSFCPNRTGLPDFENFCTALGVSDFETSRLSGPLSLGGISLWMGWMPVDIWEDPFKRMGDTDFPTVEEIRGEI